MSIINIENLTKNYGKARGIENVSFDVKKGEIFGFIGPNGAGKSTTIRLLLGLIYPTSGKATIFDKDIVADGPEIRKNIGYLPSEVFYYDNMKVIDLLKYSASFYSGDYSSRIKELSEYMELDLNRKIDDLSYGNKKKVGIVQGLLHQPDLIILDEPTSGLDPLMQQKFFTLLESERDRGATILFSSHILSEVQRLCDRVAIIKEGKIIRVESVSDLNDNKYKKVKFETTDAVSEPQNIEGVTNYSKTENKHSFLYNGDINNIIKLLSDKNVMDLSISEPTLEEIFMHYYE